MSVKNAGKKRRLNSDKCRQKKLDYVKIVDYITRPQFRKGSKVYVYTNPSLKSNIWRDRFMEDK